MTMICPYRKLIKIARQVNMNKRNLSFVRMGAKRGVIYRPAVAVVGFK